MAADWQAHERSVLHRVGSRHLPGLELTLRQRGAGLPVLFVHGATFSGRLFDIPHPDVNWLQAAADAGFCAHALDLRGYGLSKPASFPRDRPFATASEAVQDIADAVDWIAARHGGGPVSVVGWSWGTITTSLYVAGPGRGRVGALILYAPIFAERNEHWRHLLADPQDPDRLRALPPFRRVDLAETRARWDAQLPAGAGWRDEAVLQALVGASLADDAEAGATNPPSFRVPNGTFLDLWECFNGRPVHDPGAIGCPTLLIRGAQDPTSTRSDALALLDCLAAEDRAYVEIAGGTHFINAERRAPALFNHVHAFLRRIMAG